MKVMAINSDKVFSDEKFVERNKHLIPNNQLHYKDELQEKESMFRNRKLEEIPGPLTLKMKKQSIDPSKPLTASEEPSHYSEFVTKLDHIVGKITELAKSSDFSVKNTEGIEFQEMRNISLNTTKTTIPFQKRYPGRDNVINNKISGTLDANVRHEQYFFVHNEFSDFERLNCRHKEMDTGSVYNDKNNVQKLDSQYLTYRMANEYDSLTEPVPPILNHNIKYVRVNLKDLIQKEYHLGNLGKVQEPIMYEKKTSTKENVSHLDRTKCKFNKFPSQDTINQCINLNSYMQEINSENELEQETFRILISGHLTKCESPVFIIHKNCFGSSILNKDSLDFKSHRKEGNVEILLIGKFFHDNILIENVEGYPSALDLKSHMLLIDSTSVITRERFKHTFHLGLFNAILEGEFVKSRETLQFIPIFSLDIVKHKPKVVTEFDKSLSTVEISKDCPMKISTLENKGSKTNNKDNFEMSNNPKKHRLVSYSKNLQENNFTDTFTNDENQKTKEKSKESIFKKIKEGRFFKLFFNNRGNNGNNSKHEKTALNPYETRNIKIKENDEQVIPINVINKKDKNLRLNKETVGSKDPSSQKKFILEIFEVNSSNEIGSSSKMDLTEKKRNASKGIKTTRKSVKKKLNKRNTIVRNPGLTQVEGFFLQT